MATSKISKCQLDIQGAMYSSSEGTSMILDTGCIKVMCSRTALQKVKNGLHSQNIEILSDASSFNIANGQEALAGSQRARHCSQIDFSITLVNVFTELLHIQGKASCSILEWFALSLEEGLIEDYPFQEFCAGRVRRPDSSCGRDIRRRRQLDAPSSLPATGSRSASFHSRPYQILGNKLR